MRIEDKWKKYIQCNYLEKHINLPDILYSELKNAFYAGISTALLEIDSISKKNTNEFKTCMSDFINDLIDHWKNSTS